MKYCKFCGEQINANAKFCNHCGKNIVEDEVSQEHPAPQESISTNDQGAQQPSDDAVSGEPSEEQVPEAPVTKGGSSEVNESTHANQTEANVGSQGEKEIEELQKTGPMNEASKSQVAATNVAESGVQAPVNEPKKKKKGPLILFSTIAAIIVLLIGGYFYADYITSPEHLIKDFETAVKEKDKEKLSSILSVDHRNLELTDESLDGFLKLFEDQESKLNNLIESLKVGYQGSYTFEPVSLIRDGKRFLIFDNYKLVINPVSLNVSTNFVGTEIYVNGELVETSDQDYFSEEIGPFVPGELEIQAVYDTGFFHLTTEKVVLIDDPSFPEYVDLPLEGHDVSFDLYTHRYTDINSIKMYINGEDTGWDLAKNDRVGPLLTDGSMNAQFEAEFPWGTVRTNDIPITDRYMTLDFADSDTFREMIMEHIILFNEELIETYAKADPELMTTAHQDFPYYLMDDVIYNMLSGIEYTGAFHGVDFYLDSFTLEYTYDGYWVASVDTITYTEEGYYERGEPDNIEQIEEGMHFELTYDTNSEAWVITNIDDPGTMDEDRMERYTVSSPVVHQSNWASLEEEVLAELENLDPWQIDPDLAAALEELQEYVESEETDADEDADSDDESEDDEDEDDGNRV